MTTSAWSPKRHQQDIACDPCRTCQRSRRRMRNVTIHSLVRMDACEVDAFIADSTCTGVKADRLEDRHLAGPLARLEADRLEHAAKRVRDEEGAHKGDDRQKEQQLRVVGRIFGAFVNLSRRQKLPSSGAHTRAGQLSKDRSRGVARCRPLIRDSYQLFRALCQGPRHDSNVLTSRPMRSATVLGGPIQAGTLISCSIRGVVRHGWPLRVDRSYADPDDLSSLVKVSLRRLQTRPRTRLATRMMPRMFPVQWTTMPR